MATRAYEALVILKAAGTEQDVARAAAQLEEQVKKLGGKMERSEPWGRRRLAFRIERQNEGYYQFLRFQAPPARVAELERLFRLNEAIVRFMILSEDEIAPMMASAPRIGPGQPAAVQSTVRQHGADHGEPQPRLADR